MAPSKAIFDQIVQRFEERMKLHTTDRPTEDEQKLLTADDDDEEEHDDADAHMDLIEFPMDGSNVEIVIWVVLSPLRFLMHYTVPDVRQLDRHGDPTASIGVAYFASFMCLIWLIIGSYAMVASLEKLAALMDIPDALIGVTVSAAGTLRYAVRRRIIDRRLAYVDMH
jgi:Ca2+/Na+ antiporter